MEGGGLWSQRVHVDQLPTELSAPLSVGVSSMSFFSILFLEWSRLTILGSRYSDSQVPLICPTKYKREGLLSKRHSQSRVLQN